MSITYKLCNKDGNKYQERIIHHISENEYQYPEDLYGRDKSLVTFNAGKYYILYTQCSSPSEFLHTSRTIEFSEY